MKQIAVTLLILFAQLVTSAQAANCKADRVEVDPFTNERTVHTEKRMLTDRVNGFVGRVWGGNASEVLVRAISEGEKSFIAIEVRLLKTYSSSPSDEDLHEALNVKKGAKLLVLMDDDSVVKLYADRDFRTKAVYDVDVDGNYGVDARVTALYTLDEESADALTSGEAMVIRVAIESGRLGLSGRDNSINFGTNSKSKYFFKDAVLCLQQDHSVEST
jgi:hypothetical protein